MGKGNDDVKLTRDLEEVMEEKEIEKEIFLNKRIFNRDLKRVDMGFMRSTNMKTSHRVFFPPARLIKEEAVLGFMRSTIMKTSRHVILPPARPIKEDAILEVRKEMWINLVKQYVCDKQMDQIWLNNILNF